MIDLELTKKCAEWLGLDFKVLKIERTPKAFYCNAFEVRLVKRFNSRLVDYSEVFDPLENWQQFMEMVLPKFSDYDLSIDLFDGSFGITLADNLIKAGTFPSGLRRTVLEMISEKEVKG